MTKTFVAVLAAAVSLSSATALSQSATSRQVAERTWHRSAGSVSLDKRLVTADAVLVAKLIEGPKVRPVDVRPHYRRLNPDIPFEQPVLYPVTEYVLEIEDVLREASNLASGKLVTIGKVAGSVPDGNREIQVSNGSLPNVRLGARYLVFLDYADMFGMFMISDEDFFLLDGAVIVADSRAPRSGFVEELDNQNVQVGLSNVKEAADRVRKNAIVPR